MSPGASLDVFEKRYFLRAPQQMLRKHRSLKAFCATLVMKMNRKVISFFTNLLPLPKTETRLLRCSVRSLVTVQTSGVARFFGARSSKHSGRP